MNAVVVNPKKAFAVLIAMLSPWGILCGMGTLFMFLMTPVAQVFYPVFDVMFICGIWWAYKNGGFEE